ncbi:MAG: penicillin-binding protein, partial [Deltaproteobacteria bacterium HGW-Deltaproteobacteria-17]
DAWFIGFSPEIVCGVWIGYDDLKPLGSREEGGRSAVPVFVRVMKAAHKAREARDFFIPPGIASREIDPVTGEAVLPSAAVRFTEYFLEGTEPEPPTVAPDPLGAPDPDAPSAGDLLTQ